MAGRSGLAPSGKPAAGIELDGAQHQRRDQVGRQRQDAAGLGVARQCLVDRPVAIQQALAQVGGMRPLRHRLAREEHEVGALGPFPEGTAVGGLVFLSGQLGNVPGTLTLVEGGIGAEARQALDNTATILRGQGLGLDKLVPNRVGRRNLSSRVPTSVPFVEARIARAYPGLPGRQSIRITLADIEKSGVAIYRSGSLQRMNRRCPRA